MLGTVKFLIIPEIFFQDMPNMSYMPTTVQISFFMSFGRFCKNLKGRGLLDE